MIALQSKITGVKELNSRLDRVQRQVKNPRELHKRIAGYLFGAFQKNMARGVDPNGRPLAPVARWTRLARHTAYKGKLIPLNASGGLRNAMAIWDLSNKGVMIGWKGNYLKIAERMTNGTAGFMEVRNDKIRGLYSGVKSARKDGHNYIRINNDGQWITKQAPSGQVRIKPKARKFFYLTPKQVKRSMEIANNFIKEAINK